MNNSSSQEHFLNKNQHSCTFLLFLYFFQAHSTRMKKHAVTHSQVTQKFGTKTFLITMLQKKFYIITMLQMPGPMFWLLSHNKRIKIELQRITGRFRLKWLQQRLFDHDLFIAIWWLVIKVRKLNVDNGTFIDCETKTTLSLSHGKQSQFLFEKVQFY